jgi:hypothetical protein
MLWLASGYEKAARRMLALSIPRFLSNMVVNERLRSFALLQAAAFGLSY